MKSLLALTVAFAFLANTISFTLASPVPQVLPLDTDDMDTNVAVGHRTIALDDTD